MRVRIRVRVRVRGRGRIRVRGRVRGRVRVRLGHLLGLVLQPEHLSGLLLVRLLERGVGLGLGSG